MKQLIGILTLSLLFLLLLADHFHLKIFLILSFLIADILFGYMSYRLGIKKDDSLLSIRLGDFYTKTVAILMLLITLISSGVTLYLCFHSVHFN